MNAMPDLDRRVSDWLRVEASSSGSERVLAATLDRVAVTRQDRTLTRPRFGGASGWRRAALIAATVALLVVATATAVFIGSQLLTNVVPLPAPVVPPVAPVVATPPPVSVRIPTTRVGSGTASTDLGSLSWTAVAGDASNIPSSEIFLIPGGFAAIEPDLGGGGSRFWTSTDGLAWTVVPMPVPATGRVGHAVAGGEHWIWSDAAFRLWRSTDFASWSEVDISALRPRAIDGVRWSMGAGQVVTAGSTTVLRWSVIGRLALDELLGIALEPDETLEIGHSREDPVLGEPRDVNRTRLTIIGQGEEQTRVGSIRVELTDQTVTVFDAEQDRVIAEIDTTKLGVPADGLAADLNNFGFIRGPGPGALIADGRAQRLTLPPDMANLVVIDDRFVGLADDHRGGPRLVWSSTNAVDWESLGPLVGPSEPAVFQLLRPAAAESGGPLVADVMIDEAGTQRSELWTSTDGREWRSLGVISTYPEPSVFPNAVPGGYLGTGDDLRLHVSTTGADWSVVDGLSGLHASVDENGGTQMMSVTPDTVFYVDLPLTGDRFMWVMKLQDAVGQPSASPPDG